MSISSEVVQLLARPEVKNKFKAFNSFSHYLQKKMAKERQPFSGGRGSFFAAFPILHDFGRIVLEQFAYTIFTPLI